jgi:hypothetical protein
MGGNNSVKKDVILELMVVIVIIIERCHSLIDEPIYSDNNSLIDEAYHLDLYPPLDCSSFLNFLPSTACISKLPSSSLAGSKANWSRIEILSSAAAIVNCEFVKDLFENA